MGTWDREKLSGEGALSPKDKPELAEWDERRNVGFPVEYHGQRPGSKNECVKLAPGPGPP